MGKIYIGDIGTRLRTTLNTDLAGYSTLEAIPSEIRDFTSNN